MRKSGIDDDHIPLICTSRSSIMIGLSCSEYEVLFSYTVLHKCLDSITIRYLAGQLNDEAVQ